MKKTVLALNLLSICIPAQLCALPVENHKKVYFLNQMGQQKTRQCLPPGLRGVRAVTSVGCGGVALIHLYKIAAHLYATDQEAALYGFIAFINALAAYFLRDQAFNG